MEKCICEKWAQICLCVSATEEVGGNPGATEPHTVYNYNYVRVIAKRLANGNQRDSLLV